jgi:hypothetical protein
METSVTKTNPSHKIMIPQDLLERRNRVLARKLIRKHKLNLAGLTVFTEAATGSYKYAPIIAALADADRVFAITGDSKYGSKEDVGMQTMIEADVLGVHDKIVILYGKDSDCLSRSDIITNLGFVRPITAAMVSCMKTTAVIPLMWLSSEFRSEELDLPACIEKGILVMGTNEHHPSLNLFNSIGFKICKLLFNTGFSVYDDKFLLISSGDMGNSISDFFINNSIYFDRVVFDDEIPMRHRKFVSNRAEIVKNLDKYDAVIVAELYHDIDILSTKGFISTKLLKEQNPFVKIIHTYGSVNNDDICNEGLSIFPPDPKPFPYGTVCADYLGDKPTLDLITAGLRVGEVMAKCRLNGMSIEETKKYALDHCPADAL